MKLKLKSNSCRATGVRMYEKIAQGWKVTKPLRTTLLGNWIVNLTKKEVK